MEINLLPKKEMVSGNEPEEKKKSVK